MRGRNRFKLVKPVLSLGISLLKLFPRGLSSFGLAVFRYTPTLLGVGIRYVFVSRLARKCGDNVLIGEGVHMFKVENMSFGDNVSIHPMCYLDGVGELIIEDDVSIAHATTIMTTEHDFSNPELPIKDAPCTTARTVIERDVWIAAGVRILAGVRIGTNTVIGASSVITKDIPPHSLVVGIPGKVVRTIRLGDSPHDELRAAAKRQ